VDPATPWEAGAADWRVLRTERRRAGGRQFPRVCRTPVAAAGAKQVSSARCFPGSPSRARQAVAPAMVAEEERQCVQPPGSTGPSREAGGCWVAWGVPATAGVVGCAGRRPPAEARETRVVDESLAALPPWVRDRPRPLRLPRSSAKLLLPPGRHSGTLLLKACACCKLEEEKKKKKKPNLRHTLL
jgi:hypothetical protein